jgi:hypothetical protein
LGQEGEFFLPGEPPGWRARRYPASKAYQNMFDSEENRTCKKCGNVMPKP